MVITGSIELIRLKLDALYPNKKNKEYLRALEKVNNLVTK